MKKQITLEVGDVWWAVAQGIALAAAIVLASTTMVLVQVWGPILGEVLSGVITIAMLLGATALGMVLPCLRLDDTQAEYLRETGMYRREQYYNNSKKFGGPGA